MTARTQDAILNTRGTPILEELPIATGSTIYIGSMVCQLTGTTGRAVAATAATGRRFVGVARKFLGNNADGVGVADGSERVEVGYGDEVELTVATSLRTNTTIGLNPFVQDDATVGGTAVGTAGTRIAVGELVGWEDEGGTDKSTAWLAIRRFATTNIAV